ncbi:MAG: PEP/pyruvate-binding domain-containing protein, partial [Candidatus Sericytochromatia bacterium]
ITTRAYRECMEQMGFQPEALARMGYEEALQTARTIQHYFMRQSIPSNVLTEIRSAYKQLTDNLDGNVVIRPSVAYGNGVDFAKRLRPILGVKSLIELEKTLKMAWAYMWLDDIVQYRFSQEHLHQRWDDMALIIQPLIQPFVSGSLLSYDPESDDQTFVIEAARGLNEAVSRGVLVPDRFRWQRFLKKVSDRQIVAKPVRFMLAEQWAVQEVPIEQAQREQPSLIDADVAALAELAEKLVAGYQRPLEMEWCKTDKGLQLIQIMPVRLPEFESVRAEDWLDPQETAPYFEKPVSPLGWSFLEPLLNSSLKGLASYLDFPEGLLPVPAFKLQDHQLVMHPGVPAAFEQQMQHYWASVAELPPWRRYLQFLWQLMRLQFDWGRRYREFVDAMQQSWACDYESWGVENLLDALAGLSQQVGSFFQQALLVRTLNHLTGVMFSDFVQTYLPPDQVYDILMQGLPGRYAQSCQLLDAYTAEIAQNPEWARLFKQENPHHILRALQMDEQGKVWLARLVQDFHSTGFYRIGMEPLYPSWVDAPQVLIRELQDALSHQQHYWDPTLAEQRENLEEELAEGFDWLHIHQRFFFLSLLHLGQSYTALVQDEPFYAGMFMPRLRALALALARYLPLDSRQDVFYLALDEIREMIQNPMNAYKIKELRELIQARKYKRRITHRLGPEASGGLKALELRGRPASRGEVLGRVRLVTRSEDLKHLQPGEIIVTDYFEPFWEQALSKAGGLIMELGGTLSHGAMLARHYNLPALAAVEGATKRLSNGLIARLDGSSGHLLAYREEVLEAQEEFIN